MFVTGAVNLPFFSFMTFLIAVPTGVKFFNWIGTMWGGSLSFDTPMLWSVGFLTTFLFGGLTGIILASPPLDFQLSDSYFVVAHFHYVVFGTVVFAMFAGFYFWWPKFTGRMLDERLGKIHFWLLFIGFHTTFLVQHWLGVEGMPRRYATTRANEGFTVLNQVSSSARSCSVPRRCRSSTTSGSRARRRWSASTTRGAGAARWSGRPARRRRGTTSSRCRGSGPRARRSTCTTRRSRWPSTPPAAPTAGNLLDAGEDQGRLEQLEQQATAGRPPARRGRGGAGVKVEAWIFGILAVFVLIVTPIYWFMSEDPTGTTRPDDDVLPGAAGHLLPRCHRPADGPGRRTGRRRDRRGRR